MDNDTTGCIFIDKSSALWKEMQVFLEQHHDDFVECRNISFQITAENRRDDLAKEIGELLQSVGAPTRMYGYRYLIAAIELVYRKPNLLHKMTKDVYPTLAKQFHTTGDCVERNIRQVICAIWIQDNFAKLQSIFKYLPPTKPYNSEFISLMVTYLQYHD